MGGQKDKDGSDTSTLESVFATPTPGREKRCHAGISWGSDCKTHTQPHCPQPPGTGSLNLGSGGWCPDPVPATDLLANRIWEPCL
jgi:hypothetical protein